MNVPPKRQWRATASSGDPRRAVDDYYATAWTADVAETPWFEIDLGEAATLGGLEVYWGGRALEKYRFAASLDAETWTDVCRTRHGEGGQDVFAFPPVEARFVRLTSDDPSAERGPEIVEINLYAPDEAASAREEGRLAALGRGPVTVPVGESVTVDFGYVRSPLGALIAWGDDYGTVFSTHLSDDGETFREMGRIETGDGGVDSFWWRSTTSRYFRLTVHKASAPEGAVVDELKLRILNKDRMPIGQLERAARAGRGELYPQSLLGRQVYWTALGEFDQGEQALLDEYGDLEPRRGSPQITPLIRLRRRPARRAGRRERGAEARRRLAADRQRRAGPRRTSSSARPPSPVPVRPWPSTVSPIAAPPSAKGRSSSPCGRSRSTPTGSMAATPRQRGRRRRRPLWVDDKFYAAFSRAPDSAAIADFDDGDVVKLIDAGPRQTARSLRSASAWSAPPANSRSRSRPAKARRWCWRRRCAMASSPARTSPSRPRATASAAPGAKSSARAASSSATGRSATRSRLRSRSSW